MGYPEIDKLKQQIEINSRHINPYVLEFNKALRNCKGIHGVIEEVLECRPTITPLHFGLLIQAAFQYVFLRNREKWHRSAGRELSWDWMLSKIIREHREEVIEVCVERNISLTNPERYAVLKATTNCLFKEKNIVVLDVGCGFIPRGIGAIFNSDHSVVPNDEDAASLIEPLLEEPLHANRIICVDVQPQDPVWTAACFWVSLNDLKRLEETFRKDATKSFASIEFRIFDITSQNLGLLSELKGSVDLVMMSNILYQLSAGEQKRAFENIERLLKPKGWMLSLEYLSGGSRRKPFTFGALVYPKLGEKGGLGEPLEIFRLDNADCRQIMIGKDFYSVNNPG